MKIFALLLVCCLNHFAASAQKFKDVDLLKDTAISFYADEIQQTVILHTPLNDGAYRLMRDSILIAYVEIKDNKFDGGYLLFDDKKITEIGLMKKGKKYGMWLYFWNNGDIKFVENITNDISEIKFDVHIDFINSHGKIVKSILYGEILEE